MGGLVTVAHRPDDEPGLGAEHGVGHRRHDDEREIDQEILPEDDGTDEGNVGEARNVQPLEVDARLADEAFAHQPRDAEAQQRECKARGHLVRHHGEREEAEQQRQHRARDNGRQHADVGVAGHQRRAEARDRAHRHHALDAEIEDARALHHQFADGGEQQRRGCRDDGEDDGEQLVVHAFTSASGGVARRNFRR